MSKITSNNASDSLSLLSGVHAPELIQNESLADIFEATAARIPEQIALCHGAQGFSYGEINQLADRVASYLIAAGIGPGQIIGLWLPRGIDLLIMQVGIAKTGAAWLPFDAEVPIDRIKVCLDDAKATGLVSCAATAYPFADLSCPVWTAEALLTSLDTPSLRRSGVTTNDPAYVIYTSGSTGKPKGIQITQGAICHFLRSENSVLGIRQDDRVYQGFSLAFDMSFEEVWISYLVGASLWIAPREISADPDALPLALIEHSITVLHAVPTLLSLFTRDVPNLRIINLGGEACPEAVVTRWAKPDRQVFNTYGPTEATVSASLAELHAGRPVTIGQPLPNYNLLVIDPAVENGLRLLARGETGELCISGPGVAAGYLGRPELSNEKFLANPWSDNAFDTRLYRTGDLARIDEDGQIHCLGRTDDQVKIRGFRVELGEIESALMRQGGVGTTAVVLRTDDEIERLVAYLVPESEFTVSPAVLRTALTACLPPYMVPARIELLEAMPRLPSGKIDRKVLRALPLAANAADSTTSDLAENETEIILFSELSKLFPDQAILRSADFFSDLGGHSLFAARLASALRQHPQFSSVTVSQIYQQRTIGKIAETLTGDIGQQTVAETAWTPPSTYRRWICGVAQATTIPLFVVLRMAQWLAPFFAYHFFTGDPGDSIPLAILISVGVFLFVTFLEFVIAAAGKWLVTGRLKAGRYPLWGMTYFRWWVGDRLIEGAPTYMLHGSPLLVWWLRLLGAQIGKDVIIGSVTVRAHDLLSISDGVSIGNAVNLENVRVERGEMVVGPIRLETESCIGSYAVLEGNTVIEEFGHLDAQSSLKDGTRVPYGRLWQGSPARDNGPFDHSTQASRPAVKRSRLVFEALLYIAGVVLTASIFFIPLFPSFILIDWLDERTQWTEASSAPLQLIKYFLLAFPATAILIICTVLISAGLRWTFLPRVQAGSWPVHSKTYLNRWLVNQIQEASLNILHGIYATVFAPFWYRLLGAKVGRNAEISTAQGLIPDLLTLGDESFIADAVMLGDEAISGGWMTLRPTVISRRSFVGNGAFVPDGTILPENVLIGVHSRAPENHQMLPGQTWIGSPPINLPAREAICGFPEHLTFTPSLLRRLGRTIVESCRIITPHALIIAVGYTVILNILPLAGSGQWGAAIWRLALAGLLYGVGTLLLVSTLKWLLIGRYGQRAQPMWTPFVWFSEAITSLFVGFTIPNFMRYLRGTPWLPIAFRILGSKIGKGVYLDTTDFDEWDCVHIGDFSELNALCCPQTHLFEDRIMKVDHVYIGAYSTLGPRSAVLYGATVGDNAYLGPLTLIMKGEQIPANSRWHGCPAAPSVR